MLIRQLLGDSVVKFTNQINMFPGITAALRNFYLDVVLVVIVVIVNFIYILIKMANDSSK